MLPASPHAIISRGTALTVAERNWICLILLQFILSEISISLYTRTRASRQTKRWKRRYSSSWVSLQSEAEGCSRAGNSRAWRSCTGLLWSSAAVVMRKKGIVPHLMWSCLWLSSLMSPRHSVSLDKETIEILTQVVNQRGLRVISHFSCTFPVLNSCSFLPPGSCYSLANCRAVGTASWMIIVLWWFTNYNDQSCMHLLSWRVH